jgi:predicted nucleotidyltransferase
MKVSQKQIRSIVSRIAEVQNPLRIYLFGSYQRGLATGESDIDLLVIHDTRLKTAQRAAEVQRMFNPYLYDLDIIVMTPDEFESQKNQINTLAYFVNNEGELVYDGSI